MTSCLVDAYSSLSGAAADVTRRPRLARAGRHNFTLSRPGPGSQVTAGADGGQRGSGRARIGVVVGWAEPGDGSTVRPSLSPVTMPDASTAGVTPEDAGAGTRPADTILVGPISHSWYTLPAGSVDSPTMVTTSSRLAAASTTVATPPEVVLAARSLAPGADNTAAIAWCLGRRWLSCWLVLAWMRPNTTRRPRLAVAWDPASHGIQPHTRAPRRGSAW